MDQRKTALIFKAFCDENRVRILNLLRGGEKCACRLLEELSISQPTLSHHMKILCDSGIVPGLRHLPFSYFMSVQVVNIKTQSALADINLMIVYCNNVLTVVRLDVQRYRECL